MDETMPAVPTPDEELNSLAEFARFETQEASRMQSALRVIQRIERLIEWDDDKKLEQIKLICEVAIGQDMSDWADAEEVPN